VHSQNAKVTIDQSSALSVLPAGFKCWHMMTQRHSKTPADPGVHSHSYA